VSKIEPFALEQKVLADDVGAFRISTKHAGSVIIPDLKVTFSEADAKAWEDWHRSFVIEGKCTDADELSGQIEFLAPDMKEVLGTIELTHVGIHSLTRSGLEANKEGGVSSLTAGLYVENMVCNFTGQDC
jgi:hypothetical protein